ncbi:MAG: PaaI family thioesterase [Opitutaceae bacterium]|nr:PaaI family thioesterase [Opitutaceae bacterium]
MTEAAIAPTEERRQSTHQRTHSHCFACGEEAGSGLGLLFRVGFDGGVTADWSCPETYRSYEGILHGGLIATLLDSAMVHALFARGIVAMTAELRVRYRHPVRLGEPVTVAARLREHYGPLYCLEAAVRQQDAICATARAKFMT